MRTDVPRGELPRRIGRDGPAATNPHSNGDAVAVDSGDGCVGPSIETAEDGSYAPLSRPLFIYVAQSGLRRRVVREFCRFYLETANEAAREVGYVPVSDATVEENLRRFDDVVADLPAG